jgi:hypothetical protein
VSAPDPTEVTVVDEPENGRFVAVVDGQPAGVAEYRLDGDRIVFTHTQIGDEYEGRGVGSRLVAGALDDVRRRGLRIVARCPFVAGYLERHPEYADLLG